MSLEMNDLMALKSMDQKGNSPFENYIVSNKESKHANGATITGLAISVGAALTAIGAWIFGGTYANGKAAQAKEAARSASELATAYHNSTLALLNQSNSCTNNAIDKLTAIVAAERAERIAGDVTLTNTVTTAQGASQGQLSALTASQAAELGAVQNVQNTLFTQAVLGNLSECPQKVSLYSAPKPCGCPCSCSNS
jgi:hypothetical protein